MKKSKLLLTTVLLGSTLLLSGCNAQEEEPIYDSNSDIPDSGSLHAPHQFALDMVTPIAYSNVAGLNLSPGSNISLIGMAKAPYWDTIEAGAKQAISEINTLLGYTGKDKITLTFSTPEDSTYIDEQINILDEELARFPVALGIAMIDSNAFAVQFDQSIDNGIPIVSFDSGSDYDQISTQVGTNNTKASETLLSNTIKLMEQTGKLLIVSHDSNATSSTSRLDTLTSTLEEKYSDIELVDTLILDDLEEKQVTYLKQTQPTLWDNIITDSSTTPDTSDDTEDTEDTATTDNDTSSQESTSIIAGIPVTNELFTQATTIDASVLLEDILTQHPDIKGIICTNSSSSRLVIDTIDKLKLDHNLLTVCSFNAAPEQIALLESQKLDGLILQNPFGIGYATIVSCARAALDKTNAATVDTGYSWLTLDSLEDARTQNLLY